MAELPRYIFNSKAYLKLKPGKHLSINMRREDDQSGLINFMLIGENAVSLPRSPFGGIELMKSSDALEFVDTMMESLNDREVRNCSIRMYPAGYDSALTFAIHQALLYHGFHVTQEEPNHHITIRGNLEGRIHSMELRKLKKIRERGYEIREEGMEHLEEIAEFVRTCREERGQILSMTTEDLLEHARAVPGIYRLFAVRHEDALIAASIAVRVSENILYHAFPGTSLKYKSESPMVALIAFTYELCRQEGVGIMDLGTSQLDGVVMESLVKFKENMGGIQSMRRTYQRSWP